MTTPAVPLGIKCKSVLSVGLYRIVFENRGCVGQTRSTVPLLEQNVRPHVIEPPGFCMHPEKTAVPGMRINNAAKKPPLQGNNYCVCWVDQ